MLLLTAHDTAADSTRPSATPPAEQKPFQRSTLFQKLVPVYPQKGAIRVSQGQVKQHRSPKLDIILVTITLVAHAWE